MSLRPQTKMNPITFFLLWVIINAVGWVTLMFLYSRLYTIFLASTQSFNFLDLAPYIGSFIIGGAMGFLQWLLLRLHFSIVWYKWIVASVAGFGLGLLGTAWATLLDYYIIVIPPPPYLEWDPLIGGLLLGLALGCCQGVVWWPHFRHIIAWIGVNIVGWSLGLFLADVAAFLLYDVAAGKNLVYLDLIVPVVISSIFTGIVLVRLSAWLGEEETAVTLPA